MVLPDAELSPVSKCGRRCVAVNIEMVPWRAPQLESRQPPALQTNRRRLRRRCASPTFRTDRSLLVHRRLQYFTGDDERHLRGSIQLEDILQVAQSPPTGNPPVALFHIITVNRTFHIIAPDQDTLRCWITLLEFVVP